MISVALFIMVFTALFAVEQFGFSEKVSSQKFSSIAELGYRVSDALGTEDGVYILPAKSQTDKTNGTVLRYNEKFEIEWRLTTTSEDLELLSATDDLLILKAGDKFMMVSEGSSQVLIEDVDLAEYKALIVGERVYYAYHGFDKELNFLVEFGYVDRTTGEIAIVSDLPQILTTFGDIKRIAYLDLYSPRLIDNTVRYEFDVDWNRYRIELSGGEIKDEIVENFWSMSSLGYTRTMWLDNSEFLIFKKYDSKYFEIRGVNGELIQELTDTIQYDFVERGNTVDLVNSGGELRMGLRRVLSTSISVNLEEIYPLYLVNPEADQLITVLGLPLSPFQFYKIFSIRSTPYLVTGSIDGLDNSTITPIGVKVSESIYNPKNIPAWIRYILVPSVMVVILAMWTRRGKIVSNQELYPRS